MLFFGIVIDEDVIYIDKNLDYKFELKYSIHGVLKGGRAIIVPVL